jgi:hypothetical protein
MVIKKNKTGWIRIIEAFTMVLILAGLLLILLSRGAFVNPDEQEIYTIQRGILLGVELNESLRSNVFSGNINQINDYVESKKPGFLNCAARICSADDVCLTLQEIPEENVYSQSVLISASSANYNPKQLKLFCWRGSLFSIITSEENRFYIRDSADNPVAWFDTEGNIALEGSCSSSASCESLDNSFLIQNSEGQTVAFINSAGNLCIETGDCADQSASCNPSSDAFIVQDSSDNNVSYIDFNGDLCLTGVLYENYDVE